MADLHKELKIRRRVEGIFNKRQEDFLSLKEFGDYEEEKEDIIFSLAQGIDVEAKEAKIAEYQRQNYDEILRNEAQKAETKRKELQGQASEAQPTTSTAAAAAAAAEASTLVASTSNLQALGFEQPSLPPAPVLVGGNFDNSLDAGHPDMGSNDRQRMALVSGWDPEIPKRRALEEAYSTLCIT